jgi:beta-hydroxylase
VLKHKLFTLFMPILPILNWLVGKYSADSTGPVLTTDVCGRDSISQLSAMLPIIASEHWAARRLATDIEGELFFPVGLTEGGLWKKYVLTWYGDPSSEATRLFPATVGLVQRYSDVHLAMFSILGPSETIKPHCGLWRGSVRVHLCMSAPEDQPCVITVGGVSHTYEKGSVFAFDDTYEHSVVNHSNEERVVLFLDVERKMKTVTAQRFVSFFNNTIAKLTAR